MRRIRRVTCPGPRGSLTVAGFDPFALARACGGRDGEPNCGVGDTRTSTPHISTGSGRRTDRRRAIAPTHPLFTGAVSAHAPPATHGQASQPPESCESRRSASADAPAPARPSLPNGRPPTQRAPVRRERALQLIDDVDGSRVDAAQHGHVQATRGRRAGRATRAARAGTGQRTRRGRSAPRSTRSSARELEPLAHAGVQVGVVEKTRR